MPFPMLRGIMGSAQIDEKMRNNAVTKRKPLGTEKSEMAAAVPAPAVVYASVAHSAPVATRRDTQLATERGGEMRLVGKAAFQCQFR